jgi:hypothetical protein
MLAVLMRWFEDAARAKLERAEEKPEEPKPDRVGMVRLVGKKCSEGGWEFPGVANGSSALAGGAISMAGQTKRTKLGFDLTGDFDGILSQ